MSEATSGLTSPVVPHVASLMRATRAAIAAAEGFRDFSERSPDERSDIRVHLACGPACRFAHAGYTCGDRRPAFAPFIGGLFKVLMSESLSH
jgi:hypothetical protein